MELEKKAILPRNGIGRVVGGGDDKTGGSSSCSDSGGGGDGGEGGDGGGLSGGHIGGLTVWATSVFLVGELAGTGVMALPYAMEGTGYIGIPIIFLCCVVSCYTGHLIGQCWILVRARCPEYRGHVRHPFPTIAYVCYGRVGRSLLSFISNFSMLGSGVVFLIMASQNVHRLLTNLADITTPFCLIQIAVAALLVPWTWLGTPKDFWAIAIGAALSTTVAVALSLVVIVKDSADYGLADASHSHTNPLTFFEAVATMLFATCGHFAFPTFQNDMNEPEKLGKSLFISYAVLVVLYLPMALMGFLVYGNQVSPNMLLTLSPGAFTYVIIVLVTCHQFCGFVIIVNPSMQHLDELLGIPKAFSWKRIVSRTTLMLLLLFIAETVPKFSAIMSLVGGSSNLVMMLIAPVVFYLRLCRMDGCWPKIYVPLHIKTICVEILVVGTVIGIMSTYGSILSLWGSSSFTVPCYVNMTNVEGSLD